ncbi:MAG: shikimate kinase [Prolixibacteraceae bacterium]
MRIYLIGYMGSGKSTLGKELAFRLSLPFVDMDQAIEKKYGNTVQEIFKGEGEAAFRTKEQACLHEIAAGQDAVVATGGGAPCFFDNMDLMNATGCCIFLDVAPEELARRLMNARDIRPLVQEASSKEELVEKITKMMKDRRPYYEKARFIVSGNRITAEEVIDKVGGSCE